MDESVRHMYLCALKPPRCASDILDLYNLRDHFNHRPGVGIFKKLKKLVEKMKNG